MGGGGGGGGGGGSDFLHVQCGHCPKILRKTTIKESL
jgi:hypothetical protein